MNSFYSQKELEKFGFLELGQNVLISKKASIYGASQIKIGNHVRIDDFCILSGKIELGNYIHISANVSIFAGDYGVVLEDFSGVSSRSAIYAVTDDYSGEYMTNPMVSSQYRNVFGEKVVLRRHVLIGTGCTILPGVTIGEGSSVGAMSLVNKSLEEWSIYIGIPAKKMKDRSKRVLELEAEFFKDLNIMGGDNK